MILADFAIRASNLRQPASIPAGPDRFHAGDRSGACAVAKDYVAMQKSPDISGH
jgi:hypothetical protein